MCMELGTSGPGPGTARLLGSPHPCVPTSPQVCVCVWSWALADQAQVLHACWGSPTCVYSRCPCQLPGVCVCGVEHQPTRPFSSLGVSFFAVLYAQKLVLRCCVISSSLHLITGCAHPSLSVRQPLADCVLGAVRYCLFNHFLMGTHVGNGFPCEGIVAITSQSASLCARGQRRSGHTPGRDCRLPSHEPSC